MSNTNQGTTSAAPAASTKAQILAHVLDLATQFSACVEVFQLIHPSKDSDHAQRVALAKLGIQQGRLLIWGDAVGISSPPQKIARHMVPSKPSITNPDPTLPVNFGIRDPRLDEPGTSEHVRAALSEITGRPAHLSREELMEKYGLKNPRRFASVEYPALDPNRLEAFREKYALLQDLVRQNGVRPPGKRGTSMTMQRWTIQSVAKFDEFVKTVRNEVDGLITLMDVKEQVDRGMKTDIRAMGWHPELSSLIMRRDWEKLGTIREACLVDYPEYIEVTDTAMKYISEVLKASGFAHPRAASVPSIPTTSRPEAGKSSNGTGTEETGKRPSFLSHFSFRSRTKLTSKASQTPSQSPSDSGTAPKEPQRSMSEEIHRVDSPQDTHNSLLPVRSKSLSAAPDHPAPFNLDSRLAEVPTQDDSLPRNEDDANLLLLADTTNSLIERHDMFMGEGRVETRDIRGKAKDWAVGG